MYIPSERERKRVPKSTEGSSLEESSVGEREKRATSIKALKRTSKCATRVERERERERKREVKKRERGRVVRRLPR